MQILFVLALLFAIFVSIFAVMNSEPVTIKLLWKQYEFSQAIVILGSAAVGAIIVAFLGLFSKVKSSLKIRELQNKVKRLEKNIAEFQELDAKNEEINQTTKEENNGLLMNEEKISESTEEKVNIGQ
ncbi:MAG: hypothetical protein PWQ37_1167 [Candidatus Petromonas sp.]|jgi:uncharacterized integral membrane protein|nr:hypothetical protein [Candidatus Petromonas sp.]